MNQKDELRIDPSEKLAQFEKLKEFHKLINEEIPLDIITYINLICSHTDSSE